MKKILLALALALVLVTLGCTNIGQLNSTVSIPDRSKSIFVIGIPSPNYRIGIFPGKVVDGKFIKDPIRGAVFFSNPVNGYLVGDVKSSDTLAITSVRMADARTVLGPTFIPCDDAKTIVFKLQPGSVTYLGDVDFLFKNKALSINLANNIDTAKKYIDSNFTNLKGRLEYQKPELLPTNIPCGDGTNFTPIYIYVPHR